MNLIYRSVTHTQTQFSLPTVESNIVATFLGRRYRIRRLETQQDREPCMTLSYRGVPYEAKV